MKFQSRHPTINKKQITIGLIALFIGLLFYLVDRPPGEIYFVKRLVNGLSRFGRWPIIFGRLGANLPAFIHVFAFSLITAGIMACRIRGAIVICLGWGLIDILFEMGQKYHTAVNRYIPEWFDGILFLENTRSYFRQGTYDINDIIATGIGGGVALLVIVITMNKKA